ncbi:MAG: colicin E3/pyocin S6 family cytotoxin [Telluria sp.]
MDQCVSIGARNGQKRWRSKDGTRLYTWDWTHGEIEVFNKRGRHLGSLDAITGELIKDPVPGTTIDV